MEYGNLQIMALTWNQIPDTQSDLTSFDSSLDFISAIQVSPNYW